MILTKIGLKSAFWICFLIINCIEFYFFRSYISANIEYFYPSYTDQCSYLQLSYQLFENINKLGWFAGIKSTPSLATGFLFPIQPVFLYMLFGASRFTALLFNFIYFVLLQFFSLIAVQSISKKVYFSFLFLAFIFAVNVPFWVAGGLMDFRIDFIAFCLYGVVLACVVKSELFHDAKWTGITGLIATILILLRFITAVYLLSIFFMMIIYILYTINTSEKYSAAYARSKVQLKHLLLLVLSLTVIVGCYIGIYSGDLYNYYWGGHFLGSEKNIRAKEVGISGLLSRLIYYPYSVVFEQLARFWIVIFLLSLVFPLIILKYNKLNSPVVFGKSIQWKGIACAILLFFLVPLGILTMDPSKSPVVASIMGVPVIWCIMWYYLYLENKLTEDKRTLNILTSIAIVLFLISFTHHLTKLNAHKTNTELSDLKTITKMYLDIGDYAQAMKWPEIHLSVDQSCDYLVHAGVKTIYYEKRGKILQLPLDGLGVSIFSVSEKEVIQKLRLSNVLILNSKPYVDFSALPFNQAMSTFRPLLKQYAALHLRHLGDYQFRGLTYQVYVK